MQRIERRAIQPLDYEIAELTQEEINEISRRHQFAIALIVTVVIVGLTMWAVKF